MAEEHNPSVRLTLASLGDDSPQVRERIADLVSRRASRDEDVAGLFDPE